MRRCLAITILILTPALATADEPASFRHEVMAVLSRAGCNQGTCHGNLHGKGGFKLSLRGQDPHLDHAALTRDQFARRTQPEKPDQSLLLLKATGLVAHEGGVRFAAHGVEYEIFRSWIAAGMPFDEGKVAVKRLEVTPGQEQFLTAPDWQKSLTVKAHFSDDTVRDVRHLAVFESTNAKVAVDGDGLVHAEEAGETAILVRYLQQQVSVRFSFVKAGQGGAFPKGHNCIDDLVFARLKKLKLTPADLTSDGEFLRRVTLDLTGLLPTADETRRFLKDTHPDKRAKVIDELLARPEFADCWALKWSDLLRNEEKQLDAKGTKVYHDWIRGWILENKPFNEFARTLIASRGSTYANPPANYYRALRDPQIRAEATAQVFLGIRMQCARCHNHPFDKWTQNDYHQLAAFFPRVNYQIVENKRKDKLDKHEFAGEQIVVIEPEGEVKHPITGQVLSPKYLGGATFKTGTKIDRLESLGDWLAREDNPFFARTQVNRVWYHLTGKGLVDPDDDFRLSNPPANPELLDALAKDFVAHRFDLKHLVKTIVLSRTYQQSSRPRHADEAEVFALAHAQVRPLQAEPLLDAIAQVTGSQIEFDGQPLGTRAGQLASLPIPRRNEPLGLGVRFLRLFGKPERILSCDCERADDATLNQALQLITGQILNDALTRPDNRVGKMLKADTPPNEMLDELFLAALTRLPSDGERSAILERIASSPNARQAWEDVAWAIMNSKEFLLRR